MLPTKSDGKAVLWTLAALWAIHNIGVLRPVRDFLNID